MLHDSQAQAVAGEALAALPIFEQAQQLVSRETGAVIAGDQTVACQATVELARRIVTQGIFEQVAQDQGEQRGIAAHHCRIRQPYGERCIPAMLCQQGRPDFT